MAVNRMGSPTCKLQIEETKIKQLQQFKYMRKCFNGGHENQHLKS